MDEGIVVDVLDVTTDILYCSFECAHRYGGPSALLRVVGKAEFDKRHDDNVLTGDHWGAVCDCGNEYNNF